MNKLEQDFETWWEREGQEFLYALNTTTDDDIKLVAEFAWKNGAYCAEQAEQEPVGEVVSYHQAGLYDELPIGTPLYAAPVRTKDLTDFGCVPNSNGTTNQRGELLSALEALLEDYIHRVQDAWIEAGGSDISREEVLTNCEPARNAAAAIANMTGATDELP